MCGDGLPVHSPYSRRELPTFLTILTSLQNMLSEHSTASSILLSVVIQLVFGAGLLCPRLWKQPTVAGNYTGKQFRKFPKTKC